MRLQAFSKPSNRATRAAGSRQRRVTLPDHVYGIIEVESSSMLKKLVIVLGLVTGLSAAWAHTVTPGMATTNL